MRVGNVRLMHWFVGRCCLCGNNGLLNVLFTCGLYPASVDCGPDRSRGILDLKHYAAYFQEICVVSNLFVYIQHLHGIHPSMSIHRIFHLYIYMYVRLTRYHRL